MIRVHVCTQTWDDTHSEFCGRLWEQYWTLFCQLAASSSQDSQEIKHTVPLSSK